MRPKGSSSPKLNKGRYMTGVPKGTTVKRTQTADGVDRLTARSKRRTVATYRGAEGPKKSVVKKRGK